MTTPALLCAALEVAINRMLQQEASAREQCARLEGRALALTASDLDLRFVIEMVHGGVRVSGDDEVPVEVSARAPAARLLTLAMQTMDGRSGIPKGLEIDGDPELLQRFARILARAGFDPEEVAARLFGDVIAYRLAQGARGFVAWGRRSIDSLSYSAAEYLREETEDLARADDVEDWLQGVEELRDGIDRLEARLLQLESEDEEGGRAC